MNNVIKFSNATGSVECNPGVYNGLIPNVYYAN